MDYLHGSTSKNITDKYVKLLNLYSKSHTNSRELDVENIYSTCYLKINEIANCWSECENGISEVVTRIFSGLYAASMPFSLILKNGGDGLEVYCGISATQTESPDEFLKGVFLSAFPATRFEPDGIGYAIKSFEEITENKQYHCGFIKGNPSVAEGVSPVDTIIDGMGDRNWYYVLNCVPNSRKDIIARQNSLFAEASNVSELLEISFTDTDNLQNYSSTRKEFFAENYAETINQLIEKNSEALGVGQWTVTLQYGAMTEGSADLLASLIVSAFYGTKAAPEPLHKINYGKEQLIEGVSRACTDAIIPGYGVPLVSTILTSKEVAVYAALPTKDALGFAVRQYTDFDVAHSRKGSLKLGNILKNGAETNGQYTIDYNELNRHCLIVGLTGSGKTNTTKNILCNVYNSTSHKVPVMVIEPAKKEYWELYKLGFDDLQIYTVGSSDPEHNPYCLNPFERVGNISLQTHIDNVYAAFKASFIMYTPMPYVLERCIYSIYEDYGWDLKTGTNLNGTELYPTVEDLYWKIPKVVTDMGYDVKMRRDLIGSLQARINSLRLGSKGDTLNVRKSFPISEILKKNVVIELEDIGDDDVKAFIISMLLIQLVEYRRQQEDCQMEVRHLLLIEEAHRLLKNVRSGTGENADPRGAAVEFFCNLLAELRSKGQGFIIADQIPSKLAPDLIKNTNIKIVHRTVDREDRELMGGAMHMSEEQTDYLASLRMGESAVYSEGDNRPKLMKPVHANKYTTADKAHLKSEKDVLPLIRKNCYLAETTPESYSSLTNVRTVCRLCTPYCQRNPKDIFEYVDEERFRTTVTLKNAIGDKGQLELPRLRECLNTTVLLSDEAVRLSPAMKECAGRCLLQLFLDEQNMKSDKKEEIIKKYFGI